MPRRQSMSKAVDVCVTKANGQPGRRVTADSFKTVSVKNRQPLLIRPEKLFHLGPSPGGILDPPGGCNWQIHSPLNVLPMVLPLLARVYEQ